MVEWGYALLIVLFLLRVVRKGAWFAVEGVSRSALQVAFLLKLFGALALWSVYQYYYTDRSTADTFRYFDDAITLSKYLWTDPMVFFRFLFGIDLHHLDLFPVMDKLTTWSSSYNYGLANDNPTVIRINMVMAIFSFGLYQVHNVLFCFIGFVGLVWLFKACQPYFFAYPKTLYAFVFLIPSVAFWASSVLKEPILLWAIGGLVFHAVQVYRKEERSHILFVIPFVLLLWFVKGYVLACLLPGLLVLAMVAKRPRRAWLAFALVHGSIVLALFITPHISKSVDVAYILAKKQTDMYNVAEMQQASSVVLLKPIEGPGSLLLNVPGALWYSFVRPGPWEMKNVFYAFSSLENLLILSLIIFLLVQWRRPLPRALPIALWFISSAMLLGILIGNVVPILGASVRYKVPVLPLLLVGCLFFSRGRIEQLFPRWMKRPKI